MKQIFLAQLRRLRIRLSVIIAVWEAEPASDGKSNHLGGVAIVLVRPQSEEHPVAFGPQMNLPQESRQLALRGKAVDLFKVGSQRIGAKLIDCGLVHTGGEVVPDFLLARVAARSVAGQIRSEEHTSE